MAKKTKKAEQKAILSRPPIVVVLGHVDHGKTSLLDHIRQSRVAAGEHGGITQAIGAYQVPVSTKEGNRLITFIDTPGHEAFSAMRSRGAEVADIALLVVAADDGVKPQTEEAIKHIKKAAIPFVVTINKVDLPAANVEKVKRQLVKHDVLVEGYGGDVVVVPISAKTGQGINDLLEMVLLVSDLSSKPLEPDAAFSGVVIESRRDRHTGSVATLIVKTGTLHVGDDIHAEQIAGRVRGMVDEYAKRVDSAPPGKPVEVLGWNEVPSVGAQVSAGKVVEKAHTAPLHDDLEIPKPEKGVLNLIIKADTIGSLEALSAILPQGVTILSQGVGEITESEVLFAKTTGSIIIGFGTRVLPAASKLAELERVIIKTDPLIYRLAEEVEEVVEALKSGGLEEQLGVASILAKFTINNVTIAGAKVLDGRIARGDTVKIMREEKEIGRSRITSLKSGKKDVTKTETGAECGVGFDSPLDFAPGDAILAYRK